MQLMMCSINIIIIIIIIIIVVIIITIIIIIIMITQSRSLQIHHHHHHIIIIIITITTTVITIPTTIIITCSVFHEDRAVRIALGHLLLSLLQTAKHMMRYDDGLESLLLVTCILSVVVMC
jgi:hypothetical protein